MDCSNWSFISLRTFGSVELGLSMLTGLGGDSVGVAMV